MSSLTESGTDSSFAGSDDSYFYPGLNQLQLVTIVNGLSVAVASTVLIVYLAMRLLYPKEMNKLVLRLSFAILVCEVVYHASNVWASQPYDYLMTPDSPQMCAFVGGVLYELPAMLAAFYCCAIVMYYHSIIILQWKYRSSWNKILMYGPLALATLIVCITWAAGLFGWNGAYCFYINEGLSPQRYFVRVFTTWYLWTILPAFYLIPATIIIIRHLRKSASEIDHNVDGESGQKSNNHANVAARDTAIRRLTYRLIGYVVITSVSYTIPGIGFCILDMPGYESPRYLNRFINALQIINGSEGILNGLCGFFDPAMVIVYRLCRRDLCEWLLVRGDRPSLLLVRLLRYEKPRHSGVTSSDRGKIASPSLPANGRIVHTSSLTPVSLDKSYE